MAEVTRKEVYDAIDSERDYQEAMAAPHIAAALKIGEHLLSMQHNLHEAENQWYSCRPGQYGPSLEYVRKVVAQGVKIMEDYGAPRREGF